MQSREYINRLLEQTEFKLKALESNTTGWKPQHPTQTKKEFNQIFELLNTIQETINREPITPNEINKI